MKEPSKSPDTNMKILFYNIGYGTCLNGSWRHYFLKLWRYLWTPVFNVKTISKGLKHIDADVVCLAEVDTGSIRNRFFNQAQRMAKWLNTPYYSSAPKYHPDSLFKYIPIARKQHDAILSKKPGKKIKHYLNHGTKKLVQEFVVDNISIFTVHLGLLRRKLREFQLKELEQLLKKCPRPFVLCGDFNIFKGLGEIDSFIEDTGATLVDIPASFPSFKPDKHLDLFITSPDLEIMEAGVIPIQSSDHLPVWVEIGKKR